MNIVWGSLIVITVAAVAITAMLVVRRRAPDGSYFVDGDRAAGVFGVLAGGFAILAGFVVVLAFQSFDTARSGAQAEARIVAHQFETVQFLPSPARERLSGELVCYARNVVHVEWPRMGSGSVGDSPNPWGIALFATLRSIQPRSPAAQAAFAKYLDERSDREDARADRTHGADVIPAPLWIVLLVTAVTLFVFMLFFADPGEGALVQATMMGGVAIVVTSLLLLLWFLNNPYGGGVGSLKPTAMVSTLHLLERETSIVGRVDAPCDAKGTRT